MNSLPPSLLRKTRAGKILPILITSLCIWFGYISLTYAGSTSPDPITNLSALTGSVMGTIDLTWTSPGDDGDTGPIIGGKYRIKATTKTGYGFVYTDYDVEIDTDTTPDAAQSYTLTGLIAGDTYYIRIWTGDEIPNWSGISNGATTQAASGIGVENSMNYLLRYDGDDTGGSQPNLGYSVAFGDFDGDGYEDLAMGAYNASFSEANSGSVYIKFGDDKTDLGTGDKPLNISQNYDIRYDGPTTGTDQWLGISVAFGDFDGDGKMDLAMGASAADFSATDSGSVYIVYGNATRPSGELGLESGNYDIRYDGPTTGGWQELGTSVAFGDFDEDGKEDLAMGAFCADFSATDSGSVYIVYGNSSRPSGNKGLESGNYDIRYDGPTTGDFQLLGKSVAFGDFDGDGKEDLAMGASGTDFNSETNSGSVYIVYGNASRPSGELGLESGNYDIRYDGPTTGDQQELGESVAFGDFDGDGKEDLAMGAFFADFSEENSGSVYIVYGNSTRPSGIKGLESGNYDIRYDGPTTGNFQLLGQSVAFGDFDGDGKEDLAMDAYGADFNDETDSGSVYIVYGNSSRPSGELGLESGNYDIRYDGPTTGSGQYLGKSVAFGDFFGNGKDELAIGAYLTDFEGTDTGSVYVVEGEDNRNYYIWDGSVSNNWDVADNWNTNLVPLSTHTIFIPDVTNDPWLASNTTIASINIQSGAQLSLNNFDLTISSDVNLYGEIASSGFDTITVGGSWYGYAGSTFTAGSSTVTLTGTGDLLSSSTFYNLAFAMSGSTITLLSDIFVTKNVSFNGGKVTDGVSDYMIQVTPSLQNFLFIAGGTIMDFGTLDIRPNTGMLNIPSYQNYPYMYLYSSISTDTTYYLQGDVTAGSVLVYGNNNYVSTLELGGYKLTPVDVLNIGMASSNGPGVLNTSGGTIDCDGMIQVYDYGTMNAGSSDISLSGHWYVQPGGIFNAGTSTVTFRGSAGVAKNILSNGTSFYNLIITTDTSLATYKLNDDLAVLNNFTIENGSFTTDSAGNYLMNIGSSVYINGGTFEANGSTITVGANWVASSSGTFIMGTSSVSLTGTGSVENTVANKFYEVSWAYPGEVTTFNISPVTVDHAVSFNGGTITDGGKAFVLQLNPDTLNFLSIEPSTIMDFPRIDISAQTTNVSLPSYTDYPILLLQTWLSAGTTYYLEPGGITADEISVYGFSVGKVPTLDLNGELLNCQNIDVGWTSSAQAGVLRTNNGTIDCSTMYIAEYGTMYAGSSEIKVSNDWDRDPGGVFNAQTSTVIFHSASNSTLFGSSMFYCLIATDTAKAQLEFSSNTVTYVTGHLELGNMPLRSTLADDAWYLELTGTQDVYDIDVMDSNASGGSMIYAMGVSTDSGNNTNWFFETVVSTGVPASATQYNTERKFVRDSNGDLYFVYEKIYNTKERIFLARSTDNGLTWFDTTVAPIETVGDEAGGSNQQEPSLAIDSNDVLHLVWGGMSTVLDSVLGMEAKTVYSSATVPGASWSPRVKIPGDPYEGWEAGASIAVDSKDGLHIVWQGENAGGSDTRIRYSSRSATSLNWTTYVDIGDSTRRQSPSFAIDENEVLHVVSIRSDASPPERVCYSSRTIYGGSWSSWQDIAYLSGYYQNRPSIAIDSNNILHTVWCGQDAANPNHMQIKYSSCSASGGSWSSWANIQTISDCEQWDPSITINDSDNLYVVWYGSDTFSSVKNIKYSENTGSSWSSWQNLTDTSEDQASPATRWAGWRNNGGYLDIAWTSKVGANYELQFYNDYSVTMSVGFSTYPAPGNVELEDVTTIDATLSWDKEPMANGYILEASTYTNFSFIYKSSSTSNVDVSTLTVSGLTPNATYYFRVGNLFSSTTEWMHGPLYLSSSTFPAPPIIYSPSGFSTIGMTANWNTNGNSSQTIYRVQVATTPGFTTITYESDSSPGAMSEPISGLQTNTQYCIRIIALANSGDNANNMTSGNHLVTGGTAGFWKFDKGSGTSVEDSAGNSSDGSFVGSPTWTDGMYGKALNFPTGGYISIPTHSSHDLQNLTIEMWVYPTISTLDLTGADAAMAFISKRTSNTSQPYTFQIWRSGGKLCMEAHYSIETWEVAVSGDNSIELNKWQHLAVTRSNSGDDVTIKIFVNGKKIHESLNINWGTPTQNSSQPLIINRDDYHETFTDQGTYQGIIDEVRLLNYVRNEIEVEQDVGTSFRYTLANAPTNLTVPAIYASSMTLSWTGNGGSKFDVVKSSTSDFTKDVSTITLTGTTTTFFGLFENTTYWFKVRGYNGDDIATDYANIVSSKTFISNIWKSVSTGDWDMPATWHKNSTPAYGAEVYIMNGTTVTVDQNTINISELHVEAGGYIKANFGTQIIYIGTSTASQGLIDIDGTFYGQYVANYLDIYVDSGTVVVEFTGNGSFNDFNIDDGATVTVKTDIEVGDMIIKNGAVLDDTLGNNISVRNGWDQHKLGGYYITGTSTVTFNGNTGNTICGNPGSSDINFQNVVVDKSNAMSISFSSDTVIFGDLYVSSGNAYFNYGTPLCKWNVYIDGGNLNGPDNGEMLFEKNIYYTTGTFNMSNTTCTLQGSSNQDIDISTNTVIKELRIDKTGGTVYLQDDIWIDERFSMPPGNAGTFDAGNNIIYMAGDFVNIDGTFDGKTSTLVMEDDLVDTTPHSIQMNGTSNLYNLTINRFDAIYTVNAISNLDVDNILSVDRGAFRLNTDYQHMLSSGIVFGQGSLYVEARSTNVFTGTLEISSGTLRMEGGPTEADHTSLVIGKYVTANQNSSVYGSSGCAVVGYQDSTYSFAMDGYIEMEAVYFINGEVFIDAATANINKFNDIDFEEYTGTALTIVNAFSSPKSFSACYFSSCSTNVSYTTAGSSITFYNSGGDRAGEAYDDDPGEDQVFWFDTIEPNCITDLAAYTGRQIFLEWTAPSDPPFGSSEPVAGYLVKISTTNGGFFDDWAFYNTGTTYYQTWIPKNPGEQEVHILTGLFPGTTYHISIKTFDEDNNHSIFSSSATVNYIKSGYFVDYWVGSYTENTEGVEWADYDNNGTLDFAEVNWAEKIVRLWPNDGAGGFGSSYDISLTVAPDSIAWGDYDNDGDLDLAIALCEGGINRSLEIYRNKGDGTFESVYFDSEELLSDDVCWIDTDNDGDLDVFIAGQSENRLFRNDEGTFTSLTSLIIGSVSLYIYGIPADIDEDGDMDIVTPSEHASNGGLYIQRNDGNNTFTEISIIDVECCGAAVGDVDGDGYLDIVAGVGRDPDKLEIWEYQGSSITATNFSKIWEYNMTAEEIDLGDYTNDGYLDIAVVDGDTNDVVIFYSSGTPMFNFEEEHVGFGCDVSWGDVDNDYDLDLLVANQGGSNIILASMFSDVYPDETNDPPDLPSGGSIIPSVDYTNSVFKFVWGDGVDDETMDAGLYYEVRIGTEANGYNIVSPNVATPFLGSYLRPQLTESQHGLYLHPLIENVTYYAQVRTVDAGLLRSEWSSSSKYVYVAIPPGKITDLASSNNSGDVEHKVDLSWTAPGDDGFYGDASSYGIKYSTNQIFTWNDFNNATIALPSQHPMPPASQGSQENTVITGLASYTTYYFAVLAMDENNNMGLFTTSYCFTQDISSPTISDNQPDAAMWLNNDPGAVYDVDFFDIGAGLEHVEYEAWTQPFQAGTNTVTNRTMTLPGLTPGDTYYKAEWDIEDFNLLANGTNYISVNVFDTLGYAKKYTDVFTVWKDTTLPVFDNQQTGDDTWRNANVAAYNVDFYDIGGSKLEVFHVRASTNPSGVDFLTIWTTVQLNIGTTYYDTDWSLPGTVWSALHSITTNYISIEASDLAGNTSTWIDAFYVLKDTTSPTIDDQQNGDVTWRRINDGVYNVNFDDTGGSKLDKFQTKVSTGMNETGILVQDWTDVVTNIDSDLYDADWQLLAGTWNLLEPGTNYVSVRIYDVAGSTDTEVDAFYVLKDTIAPSYIDNEPGDDTWIKTGRAYNFDFIDDLSQLTSAQYCIWTLPGRTGEERKIWTTIFDLPGGTTSYTTDWSVDFNALKDSVTNYVSIIAYDIVGNSTTVNDVFYVKKDTTTPSYINTEAGGDSVWRSIGTVYNVDFDDNGSGLSNAKYSVNTQLLKAGTTMVSLTDIPGFTGGASFTTDWTIDFNALKDGTTNYVSIEIYDVSGNTDTLTDAFYVLKDTTPPTYTNSELGGDTTWWTTGRAYNVDFADSASELSGASYTAWTLPGRTGVEKVPLTAIPGVSGASYATDWTVDFASLENETTNYISIEIYDIAGGTTTVDDAFFVKKDTVDPTLNVTTSLGAYKNYIDAFGGTSFDAASGIDKVEIRIFDQDGPLYWTGSNWIVSSTWPVVSGRTSWSYSISDSTWTNNHTYNINARGKDNAGNVQVAFSTHTFKYDNEEPTSAFLNPSETHVSYLSTISGTADDNVTSGVDTVEVEIKRDDNWYWNGASWQFPSSYKLATNLSGTDWDVIVSPSMWENTRDYTIKLYVTDKATNLQSSTTHQFTFDTSDPTVMITYPSGVRHSQLPTISGTSADGSSGLVEEVSIRIYSYTDNGYWDGAGFGIPPASKETAWFLSLTSNNYQTWFSTFSAWNSGWQYQIEAKVKDTAGHYGVNYSTRTFIYDTDIPESYVGGPTNGSYINSLTSIVGTATDTGTNQGTVTVTRVAIRRNTDRLWFDGSNFTQSSIQLKLPGGTPASWVYSNLTTSDLTNGTSYYITTESQDDAIPLNVESLYHVRSATFTFDDALPVSAIQYPNNDEYFSDLLKLTTLSGTLSDNCAGVKDVYLKVYEKDYNNHFNGTNFSNTVSTVSVTLFSSSWTYTNVNLSNNMQQSTYLIYSYAEDNAGNIESLEPATTIYYDTTLPTSEVVYPVDTAYIATVPTITGTANDSDSGIQVVQISLRLDEDTTGYTGGAEDYAWTGSSWTAWAGDLWQDASGFDPWNYSIAVSSWQFGKHYWVKSRVTDNVGNVETGIGNGNHFMLTMPADNFSVTIPTNLTAGIAGNITVEARDINNDRALSYTGTVTFTTASGPETSGDGLPANYTFTLSDDGYKVFTNGLTLRRAGAARTVTVTDVGTPAINGASNSCTVSSATVSRLLVGVAGESFDPDDPSGKTGAPLAQTAGASFVVTVFATDDYFNVDTSTDAAFSATTTDPYDDNDPRAGNFINGTTTFLHIFYTAATTHTISVTATLSGTSTGYTSSDIIVSSNSASKLLIVLPGQAHDSGNNGSSTGLTGTTDDQVAGVSFDGTVRLVDDCWNLSDGANPTINVTTTDLFDSEPINQALSSGEAIFSFTCVTNSSITITAQDVGATYTSYTSTWVWVAADAASDLQVLVPGETAVPGSGKISNPSVQTAGVPFTVTVNGVDDYWNLVTSAGYLIQLTSSDSYDSEPSDENLTSGTTIFTVTLVTAGNTTVTATSGGWNDTTPLVTVSAGTATRLQLLLPNQTAVPGDVTNKGRTGTISSQMSGSTFTVTVSAVDDCYNVQASSTPIVQVVTDDPFYSGPASAALVAGIRLFDVCFISEGSFNVAVSTFSGDYLIEDSTTVTISDGLAPSAITDLSAQTATKDVRMVDLSWTAPGDDGTSGTADHYEIRYATYSFTEAQFSSIPGVRYVAVTQSAHNQETYTVTGLLAQGDTYYFSIITYDDGAQVSPVDTLTVDLNQAKAKASIKMWTGSVNTVWNNASNWTPYGVPVSTHPVDIPGASNNPVISGAASVYDLHLYNGADLTVNANLDIAITGVNDGLEINTGAVLTVNNSTITIQSGLKNNGTFNTTNALLKFTASGNQYLDSTEADSIFLSNGTLYLLAQPILSGDFIMASGTTLEMGNETIFMDGSWLNYGGTVNTSGASQLSFDGNSNAVITGAHGAGALQMYVSKGTGNLTVDSATALNFSGITVYSGTLMVNNGLTHTISGNLICATGGGKLTLDGNSTRLTVGGDVDIRSTGQVTVSNSAELDVTGSILVGDGGASGKFEILGQTTTVKVDTALTVSNNAILYSDDSTNKITSSNPASVFYSFNVGVATVNINGLTLEAADTSGMVVADSAHITNLNNITFQAFQLSATALTINETNTSTAYTFDSLYFIDSNLAYTVKAPNLVLPGTITLNNFTPAAARFKGSAAADVLIWVSETQPPDPINDLTVSPSLTTNGAITITFTAVADNPLISGDDAYVYYVRYHTLDVNDAAFSGDTTAWWNAATDMTGEPTPGAAGINESFEITGLTSWVTYYFMIKAEDISGNISDFSNSGATPGCYPSDLNTPAAYTGLSGDLFSTSRLSSITGTAQDNATQPISGLKEVRIVIRDVSSGYYWDGATAFAAAYSSHVVSGLSSWSVTVSTNLWTENIPYNVFVSAVDKAGNIQSINVSGTPAFTYEVDTSSPAAINDLSPSASGASGEVSLIFTVPQEDGTSTSTLIDYFIVGYKKGVDFSSATFATATQKIVSNPGWDAGYKDPAGLTITGLTDEVTYYFHIKSVDKAGNVSAIDTSTNTWVVPGDLTAPAAITDLAVTMGSLSGTVTLSWTVPHEDGSIGGAPDSYTIAYASYTIGLSNFYDATQLIVLNGSSNPGETITKDVSGLSNGIVYYFRIRSTDDQGNFSDLDTGPTAKTDEGDMTAPATITDLTASTPSSGGGEIDLAWTVPGEDGGSGGAPVSYDVRYATYSFDAVGFESLTAQVISNGSAVPGDTFTTRFSNLTAGERYYFRMTSVDDVGNVSAVSYIANALASYTTDTDITGSVTQADGTGITGAVVTISKNGTTIITATTFEGIYRAAGLTSGETYRVEVSWTVNGITSSVYIDSIAAGSGDVDFTLEIQYVLATITGQVIGAQMVARKRAPGVYRAPGGEGESFIELIQNNIVVVKVYTDLNGNYRIPNLLPGEYIARAFNGIAYSLPKTISVGEGENISLSFQFILLKEKDVYNFPNPCRKETTIRFLTNAVNIEVQVQIFTITGELVREIKGNELTLIGSNEYQFAWDLTNMYGEDVASGVYIYVVKVKDMTNNERASVTKKLAIIR